MRETAGWAVELRRLREKAGRPGYRQMAARVNYSVATLSAAASGRRLPTLEGWSAVTGGLDPAALYLFAIVFYWTPPHFWALSLLMKDEYARVGVPMMPVVHGEAETRRQIVLYTCLLVVLTLLPVVFGFFGAIYAVAALGLGAAFLFLSVKLQRVAERRAALRTYLFSLAYLALLFCAMVLDAQL